MYRFSVLALFRPWRDVRLQSEFDVMKHLLCIGCFEKRLGRRLTRKDFDHTNGGA
jgi:hypothetical protein